MNRKSEGHSISAPMMLPAFDIFIRTHVCIGLLWPVAGCRPHKYKALSIQNPLLSPVLLEANTEHSKTSVYVESMFWSADEQCEDTVTVSYQAIKMLPPEPKAPNEAGQHCLITRAFESLRSYVFICSLDARKRNRDCTMQSHVFINWNSSLFAAQELLDLN